MTIGQVQVLLSETEKMNNTLDRIEDALSGINESLKNLSKCVGYIPPNRFMKEGYHFLRIGGDVDTGNY